MKIYNKLIYPSLLQSANNQIPTKSWFNIKSIPNNSFVSQKSEKTHKVSFFKSWKIKIYPNEIQKEYLLNWLDNCIEIYNITNSYIKLHINMNNAYDEDNNELINRYNMRRL